MFDVVEHQEEALAGKVGREGVAQGLRGPFSHAQPLRDREPDQGRITQRGERDEDHAIGKRWRDSLGDGEREAGLSGATRSGQGEEPDHGLSQQSSNRHDRLFATDEGGERNR